MAPCRRTSVVSSWKICGEEKALKSGIVKRSTDQNWVENQDYEREVWRWENLMQKPVCFAG